MRQIIIKNIKNILFKFKLNIFLEDIYILDGKIFFCFQFNNKKYNIIAEKNNNRKKYIERTNFFLYIIMEEFLILNIQRN